jgi:Zn-dependent protease
VFTVIGSQLGGETLKNLCAIVAITNLGLAVFNLIPVPPADGYRIISLFLPWDIKRKIESFIQQNFIVTIVIAILVATQIFRVIFPFFYKIILGFIF